MDITLIFLILVGVLGLGALFMILNPKAPEKTIPQEKIEGTNFIPSQMFMGSDGLSGIAVNEQQQQICLLGLPSSTPRILSSTQLVASLVVKNSEILEQGVRSIPEDIPKWFEQQQRNLQKHINELNHDPTARSNQRIDLIVILNDQEDPFHTVNTLDMDTKEGGILFEKALSTARHWHAILDGLLLQADQFVNVQQEEISSDSPSQEAVLAELERLHGLVERKVLTQQEFTVQKNKLLAAKA